MACSLMGWLSKSWKIIKENGDPLDKDYGEQQVK